VETEGVPRGGRGQASALSRAVLDANIYVAAYLSKNPRSPNRELFQRWRAHEFVLLVSRAILEEIVEKFDALGVDPQLTVELIAHIMADAEYINVTVEDVQKVIIGDPDDDHVLACAVVGSADYLVTYDPHFDCLEGEFQGIQVLDGLHFLYVVRGDVRHGDR